MEVQNGRDRDRPVCDIGRSCYRGGQFKGGRMVML